MAGQMGKLASSRPLAAQRIAKMSAVFCHMLSGGDFEAETPHMKRKAAHE